MSDETQQTKAESAENGSLGKFRTQEALVNAYQALEKEFTKKCQQLKRSEQVDNSQEPMLVYLREDWQSKVDNFLSENPQASSFAAQIASRLVDNPDIANNENALELAYLRVLQEAYRSPTDLIEDDAFLKTYVFGNERIKEKMIRDYQKELSQAATPTMAGGGSVVLTPPHRPKTMEEAAQIAKEYFQK